MDKLPIQNQFDRIPDDILRLILNRVLDAKSLCTCLAISKRFNSLVPETAHISLHVDHIHFTDKDDDDQYQDEEQHHRGSNSAKHSLLHSLVKLFITAPIRFLAKSISKAAARAANPDQICNNNSVFYSPSEALKSFSRIERLRIQLPSHGELQLDQANNNPLLRWNATFGTQLKTCVIIAGTSIETKTEIEEEEQQGEEDSDSFLNCEATKLSKSEDERIVDRRVDRSDVARPLISNEDLKQRVVWTISCLIAASSRHHLLKRIVAEHPMLKSIEMVDEERQGTLTMNEWEIAEMRRRLENSDPLAAEEESGVERTRVPAVRMKMWCNEEVELPESGKVMKGATLVVIGAAAAADVEMEGSEFVAGVDEKIFREAAREMVKMERSYSLEMETF